MSSFLRFCWRWNKTWSRTVHVRISSRCLKSKCKTWTSVLCSPLCCFLPKNSRREHLSAVLFCRYQINQRTKVCLRVVLGFSVCTKMMNPDMHVPVRALLFVLKSDRALPMAMAFLCVLWPSLSCLSTVMRMETIARLTCDVSAVLFCSYQIPWNYSDSRLFLVLCTYI